MRGVSHLLLIVLLSSPAGATIYNVTVGSSTTNTPASGIVKCDQVLPTMDVQVTALSAYLAPASAMSVVFVIYGEGTAGSRPLLWSGSTTVSAGTGWKSGPVPNYPLLAGQTYCLGYYVSSTVTYYYSSSATTEVYAAWGSAGGRVTSVSTLLPTWITMSAPTSGGYYVQFTLDSDSDTDGDGWSAGDGDCDETNPSINPGMTELCDGVDDDCDGIVPADEIDSDWDGFAPCTGDCDDGDPWTYPGGAEICDGLDNDCLGQIDEGLTWDIDADGYTAVGSCGGTANDCDDVNYSAHPGAVETCDSADNDCDGQYDEGLSTDLDGDGHSTPGSCQGGANDCDDADGAVHPGALEECNGADDDCLSGVPPIESDSDADGIRVCEGDCDDTDAAVRPGTSEDCGNSVDDNCNGQVDEATDGDGDSYGACDDCDDTDATIHPEATEAPCNGLDDDCSGAPLPGELDDDDDGWRLCDGDCDDTAATAFPGGTEVCDGVDNDCDGSLGPDEGPENDADQDGAPACYDCDDADAERYPGAAETCGPVDLNCDGELPAESNCGDDDDGSGGGSRRRGGCNSADELGGPSGVAALALFALATRGRRRRA